ncbi:MAG: glutamate racemase [bacterium]
MAAEEMRGARAPIGVFDSGIGGLTVVRALRQRLPDEDIIYFGDTARVPYGSKSAETIARFALEDASFLLDRGVKLVVVACHSAASAALAELGRRLPVPVVGVLEPGARALVRATRRNRVGVIGTRATIVAGAYERAVRRLAPGIELLARPTPLFVPLAEEGWVEGEVPARVAHRYLDSFREEGVDALLLGCTHFPLLAGVIGEALGPGVRVVDASEETAAEVAAVLADRGLVAPGGPGRLRCYLSDFAPEFEALAARFLGGPAGELFRATPGGGENATAED